MPTTLISPSLSELQARFPLETVPIPIGGRTWQITCVTDQDALLDGVNEVEHVPYGFLLWESAVALATWLAERPTLVNGKRLLEMGAGVGLAGLIAQHLGGHVRQTDHRADLLVLAAHNAAQNQVPLPEQFIADWRDWSHAEQYDLVLGADILYERAMHHHLAPIFQRALAPGGLLLLADPSRPQALELIAAMENRGWQVGIEMQPVTLPAEIQATKTQVTKKQVTKAVNVALLTCSPT